MSKVKNPLHSLGATGCLGDSLTFTRRRGKDIAEKKPIPSYRQTLSQLYHRWLYEDYAYLWRQQTPATQATYRSNGARCHLTGFQYWMSYNLTNLPDIMGMWRLDNLSGATVKDFSRQHNDGNIVGATPYPMVINGGAHFDGVNDYIACPAQPSNDLRTKFTLEFFVEFHAFVTGRYFIGKRLGGLDFIGMRTQVTGAILYRQFKLGVKQFEIGTAPLSLNTRYFFSTTYDLANQKVKFWIDNILKGEDNSFASPETQNKSLCFGHMVEGVNGTHCAIDNVVLYNRLLDQAERERHSKRIFPIV